MSVAKVRISLTRWNASDPSTYIYERVWKFKRLDKDWKVVEPTGEPIAAR